MPQHIALPPLREAVGSVAYEHRHVQQYPARTSSREASSRMLPYRSGQQTVQPQRPMQYAATSPYVSANGPVQYSPYMQTATPHYRHPSVSTTSISSSSVTFSAEESLDEYCTSPTASSSSSATQVKSPDRKRRASTKARVDRRTCNPGKNLKEKRHRGELGGRVITMEDAFAIYLPGLELTRQMAGNHKSSGLKFTKMNDLDIFTALGIRTMDQRRKQAELDGTVEEFTAELLNVANDRKGRIGDTESLTHGTLMHVPGPPCKRGDRGICATHGRLVWTECHETRRAAAFEKNLATYRAEHGLDS